MDNQNQNRNQTQPPAETQSPTSVPPQTAAPAAPSAAPQQSPPPSVPPSPPTYVLFIVGALVVVIAAIGLVIFLGKGRSAQPGASTPTSSLIPPQSPISPTELPTPTLSTSDDVPSLEKDANATKLNDMDKEDVQINQELQGL